MLLWPQVKILIKPERNDCKISQKTSDGAGAGKPFFQKSRPALPACRPQKPGRRFGPALLLTLTPFTRPVRPTAKRPAKSRLFRPGLNRPNLQVLVDCPGRLGRLPKASFFRPRPKAAGKTGPGPITTKNSDDVIKTKN
jgi:hypothetical protein